MDRAVLKGLARLATGTCHPPGYEPEQTGAQNTKAPVVFRRGPGVSADQLNASANPTPPPKGGAHERRCGRRDANSWRRQMPVSFRNVNCGPARYFTP